MKLISDLLLGKMVIVDIQLPNNILKKYFGKVVEFHKHIDGGLVLDGSIELIEQKYIGKGIVCKLCTPELGQGNYKTDIHIVDDAIKLVHYSNSSNKSTTTIITILD